MTRKSFTPKLVEKLKTNRSAFTINKNKFIEPYKHCALVVSRKGGGAIIGIGTNNYRNDDNGSIHAEDDAFTNAKHYFRTKKSKNLNSMKRKIKVDLIVVRTTGSNSKPCYHCITDHMINNAHFNVRKVIYSDSDVEGGYITTNKNKLMNDDIHVSGFNVKKTNYNIPLNSDKNECNNLNSLNSLNTCNNTSNNCCDGNGDGIEVGEEEEGEGNKGEPNLYN